MALPGDVAATDDAFDDRIALAWRDRSDVEDGYNVYRTAGAALDFDGVDDYVSTTLDDLSGDALTIEYWFKGQSLQSAVRQQGPVDFIVAGWNVGLHILSNDGGTGDGIAVGAAATDGAWHHVAMT